MTPIRLLFCVLALFSRGALAAEPPEPAASVRADDQDEEKPDKRPEVKDLLDRLADHIKARGDEDREAIEVIDELLKEFPNSGPKDRGAIVKGIGKCFTVKRKEIEPDVPDNRLYLASAEALGRMGPESAKVLEKWINHKTLRHDIALQRKLILGLGMTKEESAVPTLIDILNSNVYAMVGAAAEALGEFERADQKVRKECFDKLLNLLMSAWGAKEGNVNDLIAAQRWEAIAAPITTSLQRLSGQDLRNPPDWREWWNDNKKRDWDASD